MRGKESDAAWVRPALLALLVATAVLYIWDLGASGWANSFYSAAVQAGTKSWKAMFFGSSDSSNFITVDKPPAFLWPMEISARIFGLNSWSMLVPQALEGVATVGLVYLSVRRWFSAQAALLGGAVVALTPVAAIMFRYNNPDALLALLLTAATYATIRGLERAQTKWLVLAGALIGFGFITKMMQAFLILPVMAVVYLLAAPTGWWRRVWQTFLMGVSLLVAAGWWVAIVALTPAADRPYVGGSQNNSILNLIFGYNGFGRLDGSESGSVGGGRVAGSMWGPTGITRLFNPTFGNMMSWLLPGALVMGAVLLIVTLRARRTDRERAALLLWGGSLVSIGLVISLGQGIIHPYYTVALAPPLGALVGIATMGLWQRRASWVGRLGLAAGLAATVVWSYILLGRTSDWFPALRPFVAGGRSARRGGDPCPPTAAQHPEAGHRAGGRAGLRRRAGRAALLDGGHCGHPAQRGDPVGDAHSRRRRGWPRRRVRGRLPAAASPVAHSAGPSGRHPGRRLPSRRRFPRGRAAPGPGAGAGAGAFPGGAPSFGGGGGFRRGAGAGAASAEVARGFLNSSQSNAALNKALQTDAGKYTWAAATVNSNNAAGYQLGSREPVMAIGGFNGTDPAPTLSQFEKYVSEGKIHYFIASGGGFGGGGFGGRRLRRRWNGHGRRRVADHVLGGVALHRRDRGRRDRLQPDHRRVVLTGSPPAQPSSSRYRASVVPSKATNRMRVTSVSAARAVVTATSAACPKG